MNAAIQYLQKVLPPAEYSQVLELLYPYMKSTPAMPNKKIEIIKGIVMAEVGFTSSQVDVHSRKRDQVKFRQITWYFVQYHNLTSLSESGKIFHGNSFDHTTVLHSCKNVKDLMYSDPDYKEQIDLIHHRIKEEFKKQFQTNATY